jgi:glycosyltransferase involved in cell wall biosynthesis
MVRRIVVDALQVGTTPTGLGRQVLAIGLALAELPESFELELRCSRAAAPLLAPAFPARTHVRTPIAASRPRSRRIIRQLVVQPLLDGRDSLLVCVGDQAPVFGRARVLLLLNDVRRLTAAETSATLERLWYRLLVPWSVRHAGTLVTISEFSRMEIDRVLGASAILVAPHPRPVAGEPAETPDGAPFLVVGALRRYKGLQTVVDALALLMPAERPQIVVCGPDEDGCADNLRQSAAALGVEPWFELRGWVHERELEGLLGSAAATVNPSLHEGYGFGVAESLARGLPTVASAIPPHLEIGGEAILAFPPGDARSLADALRRLRDRGIRLDLAARALQRSRELAQAQPTWAEIIVAAAEKS